MIETIIVNGVDLSAYSIILKHKEIGIAEPNLAYIEIPGKSGKLDITDFLGVTYKNRPILAELRIEDANTYGGARSILEALNGHDVKVSFSSEPDLYWKGRLSLNSYVRKSRKFCDAEIDVDAYPLPFNAETDEVISNV